MSKIKDIVGEFEGNYDDSLLPELRMHHRHVSLLKALDVIADELTRIADVLKERKPCQSKS